MSIQYIKHDLTATTRGVVAHGCNCQGKMGSGVALAVRNKWPDVYNKYALLCSKIDNKADLLGNVFFVNTKEGSDDLFVANCFTQVNYGYDGKVYADADAIIDCLNDTIDFALGLELPIYMHKIGCVRGGLSWEDDVLPKLETLYNSWKEHHPSLELFVCDL